MIQLSAGSKVLLGITPLDFRRGIDSICRIVRSDFEQEPKAGAIYAFVNKRSTQIRIISYDGSGFWLCTKRLSKGSFWWPKTKDEKVKPSQAKDLMMILKGQNPSGDGIYGDFRKVV